MTYTGANISPKRLYLRKNTISIAQDIPEDKYNFRAAPNTRTVSQLLIHLAVSPSWQQELHSQRVASLEGYERRSSRCYSGRQRRSRPFSRT